MEYAFRNIERKWQENWKASNAYKVSNESAKLTELIFLAFTRQPFETKFLKTEA
jgi:leucyl-tRNA synthetase